VGLFSHHHLTYQPSACTKPSSAFVQAVEILLSDSQEPSMSDTFVATGYTIEFLGIVERPAPTLDTPPQNPDSINFGPAARVTLEKAGEMVTLFWPWSWGADDGFQSTMSHAEAYARNRIECFGL
jgi:hypothetical protein